MRHRRLRSLAVLLLVATSSAILSPTVAGASLAQRRAATASQLAQVQRELRSNLTSDAQVQALASRTQSALASQQQRVDGARAAEAFATDQVAQADAQLAELARRTATAHRRLVKTAVDAYTNSASLTGGGIAAVLGTSVADFGARQAYLSATSAGVQSAIDAYRLDEASVQEARVTLVAAEDNAASVTRSAVAEETRLADVVAAQRAAEVGLMARISNLRQESSDLSSQQAQISGLIQAQAAADAARVAASRQGDSGGNNGVVSDVGLIWPIHGVVTSEYGPRWGGFHPGIDIAASYGTPIEASKSGVVVYSGYDGGYGNYVCIDHGGGLSSCYAHQSQIAVSDGESVSQGQVIGYEGSTGDSTGPHVHFEVRINGATQNPRDYLSGNP